MSAVVLPSIHEMFPEHLMHAHPHRHSAPLHHPRLTSVPAHRYDAKPYARPVPVPRTTSSPYPALLINAPHASPSPNVKAPSRRPQSPRSTSSSGSRPQSPSSDGDEDSVCRSNLGSRGPSSRKHLCGTCGKQFNRPSSLKIHENTHTGATPYRCPHPGCGRAFNVSSNMRRHLRNHGLGFGAATPATPASPLAEPELAVFRCVVPLRPRVPLSDIVAFPSGAASSSHSRPIPRSGPSGFGSIPRFWVHGKRFAYSAMSGPPDRGFPFVTV
ncbi:C2h2 conidiation transcription factor [Mycena kentingensis (nom. inval.)]|nr:C2h2 conidiation transcription factor [Mycena kentingensis (nom. inval.)]